MHLALYQPEIPQNVGTLARLGACLKVPLHLIGPLGFVLNDKHFLRAGMDYIDKAAMTSHTSWEEFMLFTHIQRAQGGRLVSLSVQSQCPYFDFHFFPEDILLAGPESSGLPAHIKESAEMSVMIPMPGSGRSLNVAVACAMVLSEALRQTRPSLSFP